MNKPKIDSIESQPLLRWAGSKRRLIPRLRSFWSHRYKRYVEPFMGSACLFFALRPARAILGDINGDLVATYHTIREHPRAVWNALQRIPVGKTSYYATRQLNPNDLSDVNKAARFIFLNRFCFNGLYRTNLQGRFNVPYAPARTGSLPS